jgi:hypothetical protein
MMPPNYQWVCQNCNHVNDSGTKKCGACGFNASYTLKELNAANNEPNDLANAESKWIGLILRLFLAIPLALIGLVFSVFGAMIPQLGVILFAIGFIYFGISAGVFFTKQSGVHVVWVILALIGLLFALKIATMKAPW